MLHTQILDYPPLSSAVRESLSDLAEVDGYAAEAGLPPLGDRVKESAARILREIGRAFPLRYGIYPMVGGKIVIHAQERKGHSVLIICAPDGRASCLVPKDGKGRRAYYDSADELPDAFVRNALGEA